MKAGTQNTWKTLVMALLMAIALPLAIYNFKGMLWRSPETVLLTTARQAAQPAMLLVDSSSCVNLDVLEASRGITYQPGRNIFDMQPLAPKKIGGGEKADEKVLEQAATPVPTSIPLKFYGFSKRRG